MNKLILFDKYSSSGAVILRWNKETGYRIDVVNLPINPKRGGIELNKLDRDKISINNLFDSLINIGWNNPCIEGMRRLKKEFNEVTTGTTSEW